MPGEVRDYLLNEASDGKLQPSSVQRHMNALKRFPLKKSKRLVDLRSFPFAGISFGAVLFGSNLCVWCPVLLL